MRNNRAGYRGGRGGRGGWNDNLPSNNTQRPIIKPGPPGRFTSSAQDANIQSPVTPPRSPSSSNSTTIMTPSPSYSPRPTVRANEQDWIEAQDQKVRLVGIPKDTKLKQIYDLLSRYGNIARIEKSGDSAFITFQPPPQPDVFLHPINVGQAHVRVDRSTIRRFQVVSPVDSDRMYYEDNILFANSIDFGITLAEKTLHIMRTVDQYKPVKVSLSLGDRKEIDVQFPFMIDGDIQRLRFRLPLSLVALIYKINNDKTGGCDLVIPFESPPQFFMQALDISKTFGEYDRNWIDFYSWYRQTDVVDSATKERLEGTPVMNHVDATIVDIGRWTTYRIAFSPEAIRGPKFKDFIDGLSDHGVSVQELETYSIEKGVVSPLPSLLEEEISGTHPSFAPSVTQDSAFGGLLAGQVNLEFSVRYQLEACLSNGFLKEHTITRKFLERLASMRSDQAVYILEKVADRQNKYLDPMDIFDIRLKVDITKKIPSYCIMSRSANITPTMIHVGTPVVETSNRIIRKHAADADRFIRVKFTDEQTEGVIHSQDNDRSDAIFDRISRAMNNGIVVAGRYYEFLAAGNSQFREHGAYFYAPTTSKSADDIRQSMGDFHHIKTPSKFGARLGQCFSTTRAIQSINVKIEMIPDIERNDFTFTDGVGRISPFLAQMAAKELGLSFDDPPSLFQFRLGGCKGVLALDPKITGSVVHIRPSQYKFEARNAGLEIIRASALANACFNRQLILILSTLGVSDMMFIRKQQEMVNYLERATKEESVALEKLQRNIDLNQTSLTMAGMVLDGFMKNKDPFMMSLLQLWRAYNIKYLKEKARIVIEDGCFVLGCIDETGILRGHYDDPQSRPDATRDEKLATLPEIFLQISSKKGHYKVIEGICVLARNPSLHPGDVRMVRAVDTPALHHLKNVVVLPQTGDRDIANMCSGGDLDGDDYIVLWDKDFLPMSVNEPPMDFTPQKPMDQEDPITVKDITNFFVTYMKNECLGIIATSHLAQADFNEDGVRGRKCLELAELHSQAVDYNKSGIPAVMRRELKPAKKPHFIESKYRPAHKTYKSRKILGMLYDQVELVDFKPLYEYSFDSRILDAFAVDEAMLIKAGEIKASYDSALRRLMAKHAIKTEFEAWSVFVLSHNLEARDYTFAEEFGRTISVLKNQFRKSCQEAAGAATRSDFALMAPFIVAMYTATAKEMDTALKECRQTKVVGGQAVPVRKMDPEHMPLISFPWLFVTELGKIASNNGATTCQLPVKGQLKEIMIQQGTPHKHAKKHVTVPEPGLGEIETTQGVTHLGELLKLDFANTKK
ncbi:RdRP-domain-containing protein [Massarina eburnea CBS 473.64]|uniref:RNA-dependent RNA polymerase n=1 Tax=Massarina eburnea CBS 473.64 TaxID=1395130 RepID=A0A6A6S958_9PLEO|nr:RdRP-domain-containing protein [Massarina eburnea CBS 473.64]